MYVYRYAYLLFIHIYIYFCPLNVEYMFSNITDIASSTIVVASLKKSKDLCHYGMRRGSIVPAAMYCHFAIPLSNFSTVTFPGGAGFLRSRKMLVVLQSDFEQLDHCEAMRYTYVGAALPPRPDKE